MSKTRDSKTSRRTRIRSRIRKRLAGTSERPRLAIFKSNKFIYAQIIDDRTGVTLLQASSHEAAGRETGAHGANLVSAKKVGTLLGERAKEKKITAVVFDRGGYLYHGRVKALAEAARETGLQF